MNSRYIELTDKKYSALRKIIIIAMSIISMEAIYLEEYLLGNGFSFTYLLIFIFIYYIFEKTYFIKKERINIKIALMSIFLSLCAIIGESFLKTNSFKLVFGGLPIFARAIVKLMGICFMLYLLIKKFYEYIESKAKEEKTKDGKILTWIFEEKPNKKIPLILIIMWLPFILLMYPGVPCYDAITQIAQIVVPQEVIYNHQPVIVSALMGGIVNIWSKLGNADLGLFTCVICQLSVLLYAIIYSFKIMRKMNISAKVQFGALAFYALCPIVYMYALTIIKDIIFSALLFIYALMMLEMLIDKKVIKSKAYLIKFSVVMLLIMIFRNNGIYNLILSVPFLIIYLKEYRKELAISALIPIIIYMIITKIGYPLLGIGEGEKSEMFSIPLQQTARTLSEGKEYEEEEMTAISKVLDTDWIKENYNPYLSDAVKMTFKEEDSENVKNYFKAWWKYLFKYPGTYISATINNVYGYIYPNYIDCVGVRIF